MAQTAKFGIAEVMDVIYYNLETGKPELFLDSLKMSNMENTAEQRHARGGRGNPILITWDYDREANFEIQDALLSPRMLEVLTGNKMETGEDQVHIREEFVAGTYDFLATDSNGEIEVSHEPIEGTVYVYERGKELTEEGEYSGDNIAISGTTITVTDDYDAELYDTEVIVYYQFMTEADDTLTFRIDADTFPGEYKMVGTTLVRNLHGVDERFQIIVPRCKIMPNFEINMEPEGDPAVFDMNMTAYRSIDSPTMIKMVKY